MDNPALTADATYWLAQANHLRVDAPAWSGWLILASAAIILTMIAIAGSRRAKS